MTVLYPNLCYNEVCYKGTVLYMLLCIASAFLSFKVFIYKRYLLIALLF